MVVAHKLFAEKHRILACKRVARGRGEQQLVMLEVALVVHNARHVYHVAILKVHFRRHGYIHRRLRAILYGALYIVVVAACRHKDEHKESDNII